MSVLDLSCTRCGWRAPQSVSVDGVPMPLIMTYQDRVSMLTAHLLEHLVRPEPRP